MKIPSKFYRGDNAPKAETVGELIKVLQELPADLQVKAGFSFRCEVAVYNHGMDTEHVKIQEPEEDC